jgi:hypothetical protein
MQGFYNDFSIYYVIQNINTIYQDHFERLDFLKLKLALKTLRLANRTCSLFSQPKPLLTRSSFPIFTSYT